MQLELIWVVKNEGSCFYDSRIETLRHHNDLDLHVDLDNFIGLNNNLGNDLYLDSPKIITNKYYVRCGLLSILICRHFVLNFADDMQNLMIWLTLKQNNLKNKNKKFFAVLKRFWIIGILLGLFKHLSPWRIF